MFVGVPTLFKQGNEYCIFVQYASPDKITSETASPTSMWRGAAADLAQLKRPYLAEGSQGGRSFT